MNFKDFLENQIKKGRTEWESRSELIRSSGNKANGHINRVLKEYESKFQFGQVTEIKDREIRKYFKSLPKNSLISVEGSVKIINKNLPKDIQISETIIYNRLRDPKFNQNNLKGQKLNNQVSKTFLYNLKISESFKDQLRQIRKPGIYLYLETTQSGNNTLRLKTSEQYGNLNKSFPPNENSLKIIKKLINEKER